MDWKKDNVKEIIDNGTVKKVKVDLEKGTFNVSGTINKTENTSETVADKRQLLTE